MIKREMFRSKLFQQFIRNEWWDAHHVDLHWRVNGKDVVEEADWLKDIWYALRGKPKQKLLPPFEYVRPYNFAEFHKDSDTGSTMLVLHFDGTLPNVEFSVSSFPEDRRYWLAEVLHRQIAEVAYKAREGGIRELRDGFRYLLGENT